MTIKVESLKRKFVYQGINFGDPNPNLSPEKVRDMLSAAHPELSTAEVEAGEIKGSTQTFVFRKTVGTKG